MKNHFQKIFVKFFASIALLTGGLASNLACNMAFATRISINEYPFQIGYLSTLSSAMVKPESNSPFMRLRRIRHLTQVPGKSETLRYAFWPQKKAAPLAFILAGLGGGHEAPTSLNVGRALHAAGFAVVSVPSSLHWNFYRSAATSALPGYVPQDANDTYLVLNKINDHLRKEFPKSFQKSILLGSSLGALHSLFIAHKDLNQSKALFNGFISLNPPVNVIYALAQIDKMNKIPLQWPAALREEKITQWMAIAVNLLGAGKPDPALIAQLPVDAQAYLIGFSFKETLNGLIWMTQEQQDLGVIKSSGDNREREARMEEIGQRFSFLSYLGQIALPYFARLRSNAELPLTPERLNLEMSLHAVRSTLSLSDRVRVFHSSDDLLINDAMLNFLESTMGNRAVVFNHGGHTGAYWYPPVLSKIVESALELSKIE